MSMTTETLTVMRARGRRLAKLVQAAGTIVGYDSAKHYDAATVAVHDLAHLHQLLRKLETRPDCCIVRGALAAGPQAQGIRRLVHADPHTGDAPTLRDTPRRWLALDLDGLPMPAGTDPRALAACAAVARAVLPTSFAGAALVVQATASHGIKPGARLRLWCWCDRPLNGAELDSWFRDAPVDRSAFRPAQVIYTAAPVIEAAEDHLPQRLLLLPGAACVTSPAPWVATVPRISTIAKARRAEVGSRYALAALTNACTRIARAGEGARHRTAVAEAWGLSRLVQRGTITEGDLRTTLRGGLTQAGKYAEEADAIVAWAIGRRAEGGVAHHA